MDGSPLAGTCTAFYGILAKNDILTTGSRSRNSRSGRLSGRGYAGYGDAVADGDELDDGDAEAEGVAVEVGVDVGVGVGVGDGDAALGETALGEADGVAEERDGAGDAVVL